MTNHEATQLAKRISGAWPTPAWEPETAVIYVQYLAPLDYHEALEIFEELIQTETWRPTIAHFHLAAKARREDRNRTTLRAGNYTPLPALERRLTADERPVPTWLFRRVPDVEDTPEEIEASRQRTLAGIARALVEDT